MSPPPGGGRDRVGVKGDFLGYTMQILLCPPFSKGDFNAAIYLSMLVYFLGPIFDLAYSLRSPRSLR